MIRGRRSTSAIENRSFMKILMALMQLDIGGAETHVLELSRALSKMGDEIVVVSNGGVYVNELAENGIRHIKIPLHQKNPVSVIKSYIKLKKLIKKEKFDIVHAHARIPAFICGLLQRKIHFRFVCSAHWVFDVNALWKRIANWGDKTIAVSEDIKQYVIDNYRVFPDNVSVTINGIDMEKFSRDIDVKSALEELSLPDDRKTVVYVSRMDKDRSEVARLLASVSPELKKKHENLQVIIVGGGDDFDYVKALADKANEKCGENFVHMTNARTDINRYIALGDIFVGVSRAVLEAMSAGLPVVVGGNEGYIGILGEENYDVAATTNFCLRGCALPNTDMLLADLDKLLSMNKEELAIIGGANRKIIENSYSATRMAKDCREIYESLYPYEYKKHGDILLSGYYGFGNMGDDSLLLSITKGLRELNPDVRITAFTKNPKEMTRKYGVRCINRFNIFAILGEMRHAKLLISGGGSLLQNNTSAKSLEYYCFIINLAKKIGLPVMVYANGIGPLYGDYSHKKVCRVLNKVDSISLREPSSFDLINEIGVTTDGGRVTVSADPAFMLSSADNARKQYLMDKFGMKSKNEKHYFAVSLRSVSGLRSAANLGEDKFISEMAAAFSEIYKKYGVCPVFVPVQASHDIEICKTVCKKTAKMCGCDEILVENLTASELTAILSDMDFAIGMRLHMLIYATVAGIPAIGISYDPKVDAFLSYSGQTATPSLSSITAEDIISIVDSIYSERDIRVRIKCRRDELISFAKLDAKTAISLASSHKL